MTSALFRQLRRWSLFLSVLMATCLLMVPAAEAARHAGHATASKPQRGHASHHGPRAKVCYAKVRRHGRLIKVRRPCGETEKVLTNSPIHEQSLDEAPKTSNGKAPGDAVVAGRGRTAIVRAYAVDGATFFHNGRKIRIEGLGPDDNAGLTHELAAQKLQRLLDSGAVSVDPIAADESGATRALVKINGRDVADLMKH